MASAEEILKQLYNLHNRRDFLRIMGAGMGAITLPTLAGCGGGDPAPNPPPPPPMLPQPSAEYTVLKRTSFGVQPDTLASIQSLGINAYLEQQLDYQSIDDGDLQTTISTTFPLTTQNSMTLLAGFPDNIGPVAQQMASATQYRQIFSQRQLYEVMVEFWSDHFNIHLLNGLGPTLKPDDDRNVIRVHALGKFRDLLGASAKSPSMLFYLDNFLNVASAPNENYARELMELHTLGVDGGYTEQDVKEVARCFTGWTIRFPGDPSGDYGTFVFQPATHDNDQKTVLANTIPAGGAVNDGEQVLDILAAHPSTAQFIARKLCQRFISDTPDGETAATVALAFTSSDGDIKTTLRALFATNEFNTTYDQKFTRPAEYLANTIRALAPDTPYPSDNGAVFFFAQSILGQLPFYWPTPDGYPDEQSYWANTSGLLNRWRLSFLSYAPFFAQIGVFQIDYLGILNGADTVTAIVAALIDNFLMRPLTDADRTTLIDWLVTTYSVAADQVLPAGVTEQFAAAVTAVLISSAYFQLR